MDVEGLRCIDLPARYGATYRIGYEDVGETPLAERPWLAFIRCRHGRVGVHGGQRLYAFTDRSRIGAQLRRLPFVERKQGDAEVRVVFHHDHMAAVLELLKPYRRRQVSEAERLRLAGMGFRKGDRQAHCDDAQTAPEIDATASAHTGTRGVGQ